MSATFSSCGKYRYDFIKRWSDGPLMAVIGHNPSRAGQVRCPSCKFVSPPDSKPAHQCPLCTWTWKRPGDDSDELTDPTVAKCMLWAREEGLAGLVMLNLCAAISTDPDGLEMMDDPVGPDNDATLLRHVGEAGLVVAAWGGLAAKSRNQRVRQRPWNVLRMLKPLTDLYALRLSMDGTPRHPLYLSNSTVPFLWLKRDAS